MNQFQKQILYTIVTMGVMLIVCGGFVAYSLIAAAGGDLSLFEWSDSAEPAAVAEGQGLASPAPIQDDASPPSTADLVAVAVAAEQAPGTVVAVFNRSGCAVCHTIPGIPGANGTIGPDLSMIGQVGDTRMAGTAAPDYIRQSIIEPNAFIAPECPGGNPCPANVMLQAFAQQFNESELDTIVSYLSGLGTDQAVALTAPATEQPEMDMTLPSESILAPFQPLPVDAPPEAKIALGKYLFFDPRLSANNSLSCASCHQPDKAFTDGQALSLGYPSTQYFRNTPTVLNTVYTRRLYRDGRMDGNDMPTLVRDHIAEAHFMSNDGRLMVERLNQIPAYVTMFEAAFGGSPGYGGVLNAITAYIQSLNSPPTPYDQYVAGDSAALSAEAQAGLALFAGKAACGRCHTPPLFSDDAFHQLGVDTSPEIFSDPERHVTFRRFFRTLGVPNYRNLQADVGLYALTLEEADRGKFRTPSLREVARTAPYMHNGRLQSLADVVRFYNDGGGLGNSAGLAPLNLNDAEVLQLVAFLESLSSEPIPVAIPILPEYSLMVLGKAEGEQE